MAVRTSARAGLLPALILTLSLLGCSSGDDPGSATSSSTASGAPSGSAEPTDEPGATDVGPEFFGMHDGRLVFGGFPELPVGSVRLWDSRTTWREIETAPGTFSWAQTDRAIRTAVDQGARPMLVLGQTPAFHATRPGSPASYGEGAGSMPRMDAWRRYVATVAERYGNQVDYQVWNEPNIINYWTGTAREMGRLTLAASEEIRRAVPDATVVSPSFALRLPAQQKWFERFWQLGGAELAAAVDVVAVNLYPTADGTPEDTLALADVAREALARTGVPADLPLWNTEINYGLLGGGAPAPISEELQRAYVMRTYLLGAGAGLGRVYWYRWDIPPIANTELSTADRSATTLAGDGWARVQAWLVGTRVEGCEPQGGAVTCTATTESGETRWFAWSTRGTVDVRLPDGAATWTDADGRTTDLGEEGRLQVGPTPVAVTVP